LNRLERLRSSLDALQLDALLLSAGEASALLGVYLQDSFMVLTRERTLIVSEHPLDLGPDMSVLVVSPYILSLDRYVVASSMQEVVAGALRGVTDAGASIGIDPSMWPSSTVQFLEKRWRIIDASREIKRTLVESIDESEVIKLFRAVCSGRVDRGLVDEVCFSRSFVGSTMISAAMNGYAVIVGEPRSESLESIVKSLATKRFDSLADAARSFAALARRRGAEIVHVRAVVPLTTLYRDAEALSMSRVVNVVAIDRHGTSASCMLLLREEGLEVLCCGDLYGEEGRDRSR